MMKAAAGRRYGPPAAVTVSEVPAPRPRDDEILVRVRAATVGVVDGLARRGPPFYTGLVRKLGAESVIDYTRTDFTRAGRSYDVIFDVAGKSSWTARFGSPRRTRASTRATRKAMTRATRKAILS